MAPQNSGSAYDGTWNSAKSIYVLPPLIGLPYSDMRANGQGARHAGDTRYYRLIVVHAVFACMAFLLFMPAAIICARFLYHGRNPRTAMYGHIGLNSASVICLTITFAAGFAAVGEGKWGTNPHHIIGTTLYVGVLFQALFGAFVRWRNINKIRKRIALHTMLHHWLGRGIFLLGLAQVPLGLYLYGSPRALFILYAIFMTIFILTWFILEYLSTHGYFHHGYVSSDSERSQREMSETGHRALTPRASEVGNTSRFEETVQTPRRGRFSLFSNVFKKRESGMNRESEQMVIDDRGTSVDTSRAPSAHSLAVGGLYPPPGRQQHIPPVPTVPAHLADPTNPNMIHRDNSDRYAPQRNDSVRDHVFRDSTTLGHAGHLPPQQHLAMPEHPVSGSPYSSQRTNSGGIGKLSDAVSEVSSPSSGNQRTFPYTHVNTQYEPVNQQYEDMPPSPMIDGGYMEADNGFIHGPMHGSQGGTVEPPMMPLPMPPEPRRPSHSRGNSRGRSSEDVVRLPISHSNEFLTIDRREATPGYETIRLSKKNPNVSVQVRVNPDGKSVTVRRIPTEEAERDRRERARQRAERAQQREMSMDRERQARRSGSARRSRRSSSIERPNTQHDSSGLANTPAPESNVSSAIAGHSGGLLGVGSVVPPQPSQSQQQQQQQQQQPKPEQPPAVIQTPANQGAPLPGWTSLGGSISPSQRGSVVSATGTEANSELEQEMAKDYRRKKRREERSGMGGQSSQGVGGSTLMSSSIGYVDDAEDGGVQWT